MGALRQLGERNGGVYGPDAERESTRGVEVMKKLNELGVLTIGNDGADIGSTNFWQSETCLEGYAFFSVNGGAIRMIVPQSLEYMLADIQTGKEVIISRLPGKGDELERFEILFDDHTDCPFNITVNSGQWDLLPEVDDRWTFTAWAEDRGKVYTAKCKVRIVKSLPCLKAWGWKS